MIFAHGEQHQACHVVDLQAFHDCERWVSTVLIDSPRPLAISGGFAAHDQAQDLQLASGQVMSLFAGWLAALRAQQRLVDHGVGDGRAQVTLVVAQCGEGLFQLGGAGVLEQVAMGAAFQGAHDQVGVGVHGQHQYLASATVARNCASASRPLVERMDMSSRTMSGASRRTCSSNWLPSSTSPTTW
jgi:hypothetical protein